MLDTNCRVRKFREHQAGKTPKTIIPMHIVFFFLILKELAVGEGNLTCGSTKVRIISDFSETMQTREWSESASKC